MIERSESNEYQPFGYLGQIPLYLTTIIVLVYVAVWLALALLQAGYAPPLSQFLYFDVWKVRSHYEVWRFVSYPLLNGLSIWFPIEMYLLYMFGRDVERFIGRTSFGMLYLTLVVVGPCLLMAASTWAQVPLALAGSSTINLAIFVAFATIYPDVELGILLTIKAKWIAAVIVGVNSLILLSGHDFIGLLAFVPTCAAAFLFIKYLRGQISFPRFSFRDFFRRRHSARSLRSLPRPRPEGGFMNRPPAPRDNVIESIDPLLDKIAKHGIGSLTAREREKLEEARAALLKKPGS